MDSHVFSRDITVDMRIIFVGPFRELADHNWSAIVPPGTVARAAYCTGHACVRPLVCVIQCLCFAGLIGINAENKFTHRDKIVYNSKIVYNLYYVVM